MRTLLRAALLHCALTVAVSAQSARPLVPYQSLLGLTLHTKAPEATTMSYTIDVAFAPEGNFPAKLVVRSGTRVISEVPARVTQRDGTMARLTFRAGVLKFGTEDGPRTLEVLVAGESAGRVDFTLTKRTGGDAFAPTVEWLVDGPWQSHAYFTQSIDPNRQPRMNFTFWVTTAELGGVPKATVEVVMKRGSTVLATSAPREVNTTTPIGKTEELTLANGQPFMADQLARMAGPFTIELRHGSRVVKTYRGEIANGAFVPHALSTLPASDPSHFLSPRALSAERGTMSSLLYSWVTVR
jgi:hypothetical protein